jgi:phospholipid N-methyltransferase
MKTDPPQGRNLARAPDWWLFLTKFLRQGTAIAALAPSSRWLARAVVAGIDFSQARCLVELGAGTGPITTELLRAVGPQCRVLIIERDPDFCQRLRQRFPQADIVQADAFDLEKLLDQRGIGQVDHVISGLPLPSIPPPERERLLALIGRRLTSGGTLRQLTHMPYVYFGMYRGYFDDVRFRLVARNLPPGGVYECRGYHGPRRPEAGG